MGNKFLILSILLLVVLIFQNCGNVNVAHNEATSLAGSDSGPGPSPDPAPAKFAPYKTMIVAVSQCPNSANNTCRSGIISLDIAAANIQFFDLGPQASGNQPFFTKVFEQGEIMRFAVSQQYSEMPTANTFKGTVWLVEYNKVTKQFKKILEEVSANNLMAFFLAEWTDCDGDSVKDWIQYSGSTYPYQILCRSSVTGAVIKSIYLGGDLPRAMVKDIDGDGQPDILAEGGGGRVAFYGSKTMAPGVAPVVTWALPSGNTSFHGFPANFDADGDGWNDVIDTPVDNFNRSVFIYSGKTGQMLKEIISPTGQKLMYPRAAKYLVGTSSQLAFNVVVPVTATGGSMGSSLMIYNSDGTKAGEFSSQDFFDSFAGLSPKPACWSGCLNPNYISLATPDLDGDGFNDFIGSSFALFSLKSKTGQLYMATTPYYFLNSLSVSPYFFR